VEGPRFDAWTRRRFGIAAGGLSASLLGLAAIDDTEAKKGKKKKCKKLGAGCKTSGKKKRCCKAFSCEPNAAGAQHCCKDDAKPCTLSSDCCSTLCQSDVCFCKSDGQSCSEDQQCCSRVCGDFLCRAEPCTDIGEACTVDGDCCSGNCDANLCAAP
jgi:hypothetical protein